METIKRKSYIKSVLQYVAIYTRHSTFHGVNQITLSVNKHWLEPLFWLCVLCTFGAGATWTIFQSYQRYLANPTVITLDKSYRLWNITFPATTFCFVNKFDSIKAKYLIQSKWKVESGPKFEYYMKFLNTLSNSSYYNLADFEEFQNDRELLQENLTSLMNQVTFEVNKMSPILFNKKISYFFKVMLEMGICYSVASLLAREFIPTSTKSIETDSGPSDSYEAQYCVYLHASCYGMIEELPREVMVYIHSPNEVPIAASSYHTLYYGYHMELAYDQFDITASSHVRRLHPQQRRCYFFNEPIKGSIKYYSFNNCIMECRKSLAMRWCNCVPHFYKTTKGQPECNIKQLSCVHRKSSELLALSQKRNDTEKLCTCYPSCEDSYVVFDYETISKHDIVVAEEKIISTRYRWAIEKYSTTRYRRDIIFGVEELIVSFGGTACFFLGGSLMSGIELIYFFSVRFIRFLKR